MVVPLAVAAYQPNELRQSRRTVLDAHDVFQRHLRVRDDHLLRVELHERREGHERSEVRHGAGGCQAGVQVIQLEPPGRDSSRRVSRIHLRSQDAGRVERDRKVRGFRRLPTVRQIVHGPLKLLNLQEHDGVGEGAFALGIEVLASVPRNALREIFQAHGAGHAEVPEGGPDVVLDRHGDGLPHLLRIRATQQIQHGQVVGTL
mmetsp:Transcript_8103/g.30439  ORF Transcript_8103/g.30439 Transcript_8103/m.30439 type:complete len:203 (-) Transcript_8103:1383-1991(-)|eukprot:scaffold2739_cov257-Pinguiococcus_pyrenoidosus.AAC.35